jgi:futalosine hydrolase
MGVIENKKWKTLFDLGLEKPGRSPYSNGWLVNRSPIIKTITLPKVKGISVNEISTLPKKIKLIKEKFNPATESLEGAALHHVAISENIPFVQLRALSNYIGERDKQKWRLKQAIVNLDEELNKLLVSLNPRRS